MTSPRGVMKSLMARLFVRRAAVILIVLIVCGSVLLACSDQSLPGLQQQEVLVLPEAGSLPAQLLQEKCGACHGVPQADIHPPEMWPGVVYRMQMRMQSKGFKPLTERERELIVDYLQRHAGGKEDK